MYSLPITLNPEARNCLVSLSLFFRSTFRRPISNPHARTSALIDVRPGQQAEQNALLLIKHALMMAVEKEEKGRREGKEKEQEPGRGKTRSRPMEYANRWTQETWLHEVEKRLSIYKEEQGNIQVLFLNGILHGSHPDLALESIAKHLGFAAQRVKEIKALPIPSALALIEKYLIQDHNKSSNKEQDKQAALPVPPSQAPLSDLNPPLKLVIVLSHFDRFLLSTQYFVYSLLNMFHTSQQGFCGVVLGITCVYDTLQTLEKRIKSRFSGRCFLVPPVLFQYELSVGASPPVALVPEVSVELSEAHNKNKNLVAIGGGKSNTIPKGSVPVVEQECILRRASKIGIRDVFQRAVARDGLHVAAKSFGIYKHQHPNQYHSPANTINNNSNNNSKVKSRQKGNKTSVIPISTGVFYRDNARFLIQSLSELEARLLLSLLRLQLEEELHHPSFESVYQRLHSITSIHNESWSAYGGSRAVGITMSIGEEHHSYVVARKAWQRLEETRQIISVGSDRWRLNEPDFKAFLARIRNHGDFSDDVRNAATAWLK